MASRYSFAGNLSLQAEYEPGIRTVVGWVGLVGLSKHRPAEGDRRDVGGWTNQPTVRTPSSLISESNDFGQHSSDARSLVVGSDGDDHEIAVLGQWPETFVLDAVVRGHCDDFAVVIRDDDLTIERRLFDVVTPADETRDDLSHFVEPWRPIVAEVE